jgi:hypothetical protein
MSATPSLRFIIHNSSFILFHTLFLGLTLSVGMLAVGCAPSIRYSSHASLESSGEKPSMKVSPDWDYRKNYRLPQPRLLKVIESYIGVRYRWGGTDRSGIDCSGLVVAVFGEVAHARLPRSAGAQYKLGRSIDQNHAEAGDLVFFHSGVFGAIGHVGIMVDAKRFVHAPGTHKGVMYSSLDEEYFQRHFAGIRRLFS